MQLPPPQGQLVPQLIRHPAFASRIVSIRCDVQWTSSHLQFLMLSCTRPALPASCPPGGTELLATARLRSGQVLGAPVAGSDVRASVTTGGGLRLRGLVPAIRPRRLQMIFPLSGADRRGLVSLEAKKRKVAPPNPTPPKPPPCAHRQAEAPELAHMPGACLQPAPASYKIPSNSCLPACTVCSSNARMHSGNVNLRRTPGCQSVSATRSNPVPSIMQMHLHMLTLIMLSYERLDCMPNGWYRCYSST